MLLGEDFSLNGLTFPNLTLNLRPGGLKRWSIPTWCSTARAVCIRYAKNRSSFIHVHYGDLYSASSRLLLRSAPDPCTAKKKSFETRVECVRKNPGEQSL